MMPLSYHLLNSWLIALETMRLLVQISTPFLGTPVKTDLFTGKNVKFSKSFRSETWEYFFNQGDFKETNRI